MWTLGQVAKSLSRHIRNVSWLGLCLALLMHMLLIWLLLALAGESKLVDLAAYPYYYMTTATTIGYGDLSPQTTPGRLVVAFFLMPGAVAFFAAVLTKTSASLSAYWRRHREGRMSYEHLSGHTILVGWTGSESDQLVDLLLSDANTDDEGLVVISKELQENHRPEQMKFVKVESYTDVDCYPRASIDGASRVIVHAGSDDEAIAAIFAMKSHRPLAHVVAYFSDRKAAELVRNHYPDIEAILPMTAALLARAAQDPGSSVVTQDLLCRDNGHTQFSLQLPSDFNMCQVFEIADAFRKLGALLIAVRNPGARDLHVNPIRNQVLIPDTTVFYVAANRISPELLQVAA